MRVKQHTQRFISYSTYQGMLDELQDGIDSGVFEELQEHLETETPFGSNYDPSIYLTDSPNNEEPNPDEGKEKNKSILYVTIAGIAIILILIIIKKF